MKKTKFFAAILLALAASAAFALQEIPIASANRVAGTVNGPDMYVRDATGRGAVDNGVIVNSYVTSVTGSASLTFKIQGKTPQGEYYDLPGAALTGVTPVAATVNVLVVRPGITSAAGSTISVSLPAVFRVVSTLSQSGSVTYSIGVTRSN